MPHLFYLPLAPFDVLASNAVRTPWTQEPPDERQRLRPVQDRHRTLQLAHGGSDDRRQPLRRAPGADGALAAVRGVRVELYGSLGATGKGHGTDKAVMLGLEGCLPDRIDPDEVEPRLARIRQGLCLSLAGTHVIDFQEMAHLFYFRRLLGAVQAGAHSNGMRFLAVDGQGGPLAEGIYYSIGGGFVVDGQGGKGTTPLRPPACRIRSAPAPTCWALAAQAGCPSPRWCCATSARRTPSAVRAGLLDIWSAMSACVERGCRMEGELPGPLRVKRRAPELRRQLRARSEESLRDPLAMLDWVNLYAMAVNEENAAGGRVVTAPTNGAAGVIPAVLHYYARFVPGANDDGIVDFLLTAAAIGAIYKETASISGAEVGCQGEVGVACSMAAAALAAVMGGTPEQVENAAEIGMEHNLGMTCDPVGGRVQIPCIERNAMGAIKAINASRMALKGDGQHYVPLDAVIKTMRETGPT